MKFKIDRPQKKARIEIIPLIDVIFFLLATFVLVSLSMTRLQGIEFNLPVARAQGTPEENEVRVVAVLPNDQYAWDRQVMSYDQVLVKIAQYRRESPDPRILIEGEESADFGQAVAILDAARKEGISRISIKTKLAPVLLNQ